MRDRSSQAIHSLFGILAVNGILLVLPGTAHGAAALAPTGDNGAHAPVAVADIAASIECALAEAVVVAQDPEGVVEPDCKNQDGSPRACTPSEEFKQCLDNAGDAVRQCYERTKEGFDRALCDAGLFADVVACEMQLLGHLIWPWA